MLEKKSYRGGESGKPITVVICTECRESIDSHGFRKNDWFPHKPNCSLYQAPTTAGADSGPGSAADPGSKPQRSKPQP